MKISIISVCYVPEGIAMAADSRLTLTKASCDNIYQYTSSDNSQKLFLLRKVRAGISFCGDAIIENNTIADFIRKYEIEKVGNGFSIENVALELAKYLNEHPASTEFLVGGYTNDEPFVYAVTMGCISRLNKNDNTEITYGANWKGRIDAAVKLLGAGSDATYAFHLMPLKDAVEFAEYIVELTIKYEKFTDILQTCGGSIDILVLTKDDAVFYQHKIYNPKRF